MAPVDRPEESESNGSTEKPTEKAPKKPKPPKTPKPDVSEDDEQIDEKVADTVNSTRKGPVLEKSTSGKSGSIKDDSPSVSDKDSKDELSE